MTRSISVAGALLLAGLMPTSISHAVPRVLEFCPITCPSSATLLESSFARTECDGVTTAPVAWTKQPRSWFANPDLATVCALREFDVILFPTMNGEIGDGLLAANPNLASVLGGARRAFVTGLHLEHVPSDETLVNMLHNSVAWLAADCDAEGCGVDLCPSSTDQQPAVLALSDFRSSGTRYSYLPWSGVGVSAGPVVALDDVTFFLNPAWGTGPHPIFANTTDTDDCSVCTVDNWEQTIHQTWRSGQPGGFESNGFLANLSAELETTPGCGTSNSDFLDYNLGGLTLDICPNMPPTCSTRCYPPFECTGPNATDTPFVVDVSDPECDTLTAVCTGPGTVSCEVVGDEVRVDVTDAPLGANCYTITVYDTDGGSSTCMTTIVVQDTIPPVFSCPAPVSVPAAECCRKLDKLALGFGMADDDCEGFLPIDELWDTANDLFCDGEHTVALESHDASGNTRLCEVKVTIAAPVPAPGCDFLVANPDGTYTVDFPEPAYCDGTCCTPHLNGIAVEDGDVVRFVWDIEERVVIDGDVLVFYGMRFCRSLVCDGVELCSKCDPVDGTVEAYLPFFREDGHGTNKPGSAIVLFNPNTADATARLRFYSCNGDVIQTTKGSSYPVVIAGTGNESVPPITTRMRLRDIFIAPGLTQYGNVVIETEIPVGSTLTHRVEGRIYIFADGDDLNTPEGFVLSSQWETSRELWDDFYLSVNTSPNQSLFREFVVIQNPHASPASFEIEFRDPNGDPVVPVGPAPPAGGVIPAHGCYAYNTAMLQGCGGAATLQGNATITGTTLPLVGCSVTFGQNACLHPDPDQGEPRLGTDLRTDLRK